MIFLCDVRVSACAYVLLHQKSAQIIEVPVTWESRQGRFHCMYNVASVTMQVIGHGTENLLLCIAI